MFRLSSDLDEVSNVLPLLGLDLTKEQFTVSGCDGAHIFTHDDVVCVMSSCQRAHQKCPKQAAVSITQFVHLKHSLRGAA